MSLNINFFNNKNIYIYNLYYLSISTCILSNLSKKTSIHAVDPDSRIWILATVLEVDIKQDRVNVN